MADFSRNNQCLVRKMVIVMAEAKPVRTLDVPETEWRLRQKLHYSNERDSQVLADIGCVTEIPSEAADAALQALLRSINHTN